MVTNITANTWPVTTNQSVLNGSNIKFYATDNIANCEIGNYGAASDYFAIKASGAAALSVSGNGLKLFASTSGPATSTAIDMNCAKALILGKGATATKTGLTPVEGMLFYDTTLHKLCVYTGGAWETVTSA